MVWIFVCGDWLKHLWPQSTIWCRDWFGFVATIVFGHCNVKCSLTALLPYLWFPFPWPGGGAYFFEMSMFPWPRRFSPTVFACLPDFWCHPAFRFTWKAWPKGLRGGACGGMATKRHHPLQNITKLGRPQHHAARNPTFVRVKPWKRKQQRTSKPPHGVTGKTLRSGCTGNGSPDLQALVVRSCFLSSLTPSLLDFVIFCSVMF